MKNEKIKIFAVCLLLLATLSLSMISNVVAHYPPIEVKTYAYISAAPNPVGINQIVFTNFWLNMPPPTASGAFGDRWGFNVTITDPAGSKQKINLNSDAVGGAYTTFVPTQLGKYTIDFNFPGQVLTGQNPNPANPAATRNNAYVNDTFLPSSASTTVTVQQATVQPYPTNPVPTGYWQRPIQGMNTEWYTIGGDWLGLGIKLDFGATGTYDNNGNFNPYTTAPDSAHVLWTKPVAFGGQVGGAIGGTEDSVYYTGMQYEPKFSPIIMSGVLYYVNYPSSSSNPSGWSAVDIRTGEQLWFKNTTQLLRCGQELEFLTPNQYGVTPYLWAISGRTLTMCDAFTGMDILSVENNSATWFTLSQDEGGNLIAYFFNSTTYQLGKWNSTQAIMGKGSTNWSWRPATGSRYDFGRGIMWNVTLATDRSKFAMSFAGGLAGLNLAAVSDGVIVVNNLMTGTYQSSTIEMGYSTDDGHLIWGPLNRTQAKDSSGSNGPAADGIYTQYTKETRSWIGINILTGATAWGPTTSYNEPWGYYNQKSATYAYGNLYAWSYGGQVHCWDMKTGAEKWTWSTGSSGLETIYGVWPLWIINNYEATIADGKLYVEAGHTYNPPLFKGARVYALNATSANPNGELLWSTLGFFCSSPLAIADGIMVGINSYDNQIYSFGKGQSGVSVTYSPVIGSSNSVLIKGSVTDQSPGQTCLGIPAAGTPAIADNSMSPWMEYLYQQQPKPTNATGVPVHLTATDPNGNFQDIGTVTSNIDGDFAYMWTPPVPGIYAVKATFDGSKSYYSSYGTTEFAIAQSPAAVITPTPQPTSTTPQITSSPSQSPSQTASPSAAPQPTGGIPTMTYIAVTAAIVIVAVVAAAVVLRRRK